MTSTDKQPREQKLRRIFRSKNAERAQEIREAYYKVVEYLSVLTESLTDLTTSVHTLKSRGNAEQRAGTHL